MSTAVPIDYCRSSPGDLAMSAAIRRAQFRLNWLDHHLDQRSPLDHDAQVAIWPRRQVEHVLHGARPKAPPQQVGGIGLQLDQLVVAQAD
jgi:hypothetical protein